MSENFLGQLTDGDTVGELIAKRLGETNRAWEKGDYSRADELQKLRDEYIPRFAENESLLPEAAKLFTKEINRLLNDPRFLSSRNLDEAIHDARALLADRKFEALPKQMLKLQGTIDQAGRLGTLDVDIHGPQAWQIMQDMQSLVSSGHLNAEDVQGILIGFENTLLLQGIPEPEGHDHRHDFRDNRDMFGAADTPVSPDQGMTTSMTIKPVT